MRSFFIRLSIVLALVVFLMLGLTLMTAVRQSSEQARLIAMLNTYCAQEQGDNCAVWVRQMTADHAALLLNCNRSATQLEDCLEQNLLHP